MGRAFLRPQEAEIQGHSILSSCFVPLYSPVFGSKGLPPTERAHPEAFGLVVYLVQRRKGSDTNLAF